MKKIAMFFALIACAFAQAVSANSATVTSMTGSVTAQLGTATPRALRVGDQVQQGVTVSTGAASSATLRFEDGQIVALTPNTKMQITTYDYQPQTGTGNVLLSLINGGMRAVTGLIGKASPTKVSYRAATATIGIRGTESDIATDGRDVAIRQIFGTVNVFINGENFTVGPGFGFVFRFGNPPRPPLPIGNIVFPSLLGPFMNDLSAFPPFGGAGGAGGAGGDGGAGGASGGPAGVGGLGGGPGGGGGGSSGSVSPK